MGSIVIRRHNDAHIFIDCDNGTAKDISEHFSFLVPNAKFHPLVRNKVWDGRIRLLNLNTRLMYYGLKEKVIEWAKENAYEVEDDTPQPEFSAAEYTHIISKVPCTLTPRDYQEAAIVHALQEERALLLSPTASGKSLIAYMVSAYHLSFKRKVLIVVPTVSLVSQMATDFEEYAGGPLNIKRITGGVDKNDMKEPVVITTWQSIYKQPKKWFDQFDAVIGDEAHLFQAKSLSSIMEKLTDCRYRLGMTGTLNGSKTHELVLQGLFGPIFKVTTTKELMDKGVTAKLRIKAIVLNHSESNCNLLKKSTYQDEISWLINYEPRNEFIKQMTLSMEGNILLLFGIIEHGKYLEKEIKNATNRPVYLVYGMVDADEREAVRRIVETSDNAIIIASYGTFSTGVNIKRLHYVAFLHPTKSRIRTLQSIGRSLRKHEDKLEATLFDIADNLKHKTRENYTLKHFRERIKFYDEEQFEYKVLPFKVS